ncbi:MAG: hypothetical protein ACRC35_14085 [Angustibacter sp.]
MIRTRLRSKPAAASAVPAQHRRSVGPDAPVRDVMADATVITDIVAGASGQAPGTRTRGTCTAGGWTVTWVQSSSGSVRVTDDIPGLVVVVGDDATSDVLSTTVLLGSGGSAMVRAESAPPALMITGERARTVPRIPGLDDVVRLAGDDRLLVLSADALDALPGLLPQHRPWAEDAGARSPAGLLDHLFRKLAVGSGAVIVPSGRPSPAAVWP